MRLVSISLIISAVIVSLVLVVMMAPACQFAPAIFGPVCPVVFQLAGSFGGLLGYLTFAFYLISDLAAGVLSNVTARYVLAAAAVAFFAFLCYRSGGRILWLAPIFVLVLPLVFPSVFIGLLAVLFTRTPLGSYSVCGNAAFAACLWPDFGPLYVVFVLLPSVFVFKLAGARAKQMRLKEAEVALRTIGGATGKATSRVESAIEKGTDPTGLVRKLPFGGEEVFEE